MRIGFLFSKITEYVFVWKNREPFLDVHLGIEFSIFWRSRRALRELEDRIEML